MNINDTIQINILSKEGLLIGKSIGIVKEINVSNTQLKLYFCDDTPPQPTPISYKLITISTNDVWFNGNEYLCSITR